MYTWNFDEQPFKSEGILATSQRGENAMTYATMNNKLFILGGNDGNHYEILFMNNKEKIYL